MQDTSSIFALDNKMPIDYIGVRTNFIVGKYVSCSTFEKYLYIIRGYMGHFLQHIVLNSELER